MKTLKDYLEETIRRYGAVGSSRGMGYTLENDQLDEILGPDQLSKLQSIKSQLPKAGGQKPSVPTDADRAEADAWLAGLKGGTPAAAPAVSGDAPINFDRPGRPRSVSHGELQNKIAKLKSIKGLLKSISKMEPRATRAANKVGGSEEIATKSQMMQDMINNLNISYTSSQELDSIERRMGEYLQQLTAKGAAWTRPTRANKHGAVTIIKPGEIAEDDFEEGRAIKPVADNAAAAAKLYQYVSRNLTDLASMASFHEDRGEGYHDAKLDGLFKLPNGSPIYVIFGGSSLVLIQNTLFVPVQMYYQYRGFLRRESFLPKVKAALENPKNSWDEVGNAAPERDVDEGWKQIAGAGALAAATALGGYAAGSRDSGNGFSNTKGIDQFNKPTAAQVQPLKTQADLDAYNKTRPAGTSKLLNLPKDFEENAASNDPLLAKAVDLAPVSALEESAELRLILQRAKLIE
jgi:hypothetical protein